MRITKANPERKAKRRFKRAVKMAGYQPNGPREVARRKRQIDSGRLKPT